MKKSLIIILLLIIAAGGFFFYLSIDQYDTSKYTASTSKGLERGSFMEFNLPNPSNENVFLDSSVKKIIVAFTKDTGHLVNEYISSKPKEFMRLKYAMLILDISKVPVVIRNTFVLPSLQNSNYLTALIYNDQIAGVFKDPKHANKIHVISVLNNRILSLEFASSKKELDKLLK